MDEVDGAFLGDAQAARLGDAADVPGEDLDAREGGRGRPRGAART